MRFVFQAFKPSLVLSAVENVEIPLLLRGVGAKETRARAVETLELVGLGDRAGHRPDQLSPGASNSAWPWHCDHFLSRP